MASFDLLTTSPCGIFTVLPKGKNKTISQCRVGLRGPGTQRRQVTGSPPAREREAVARVRAGQSRGQGGEDWRAGRRPHSPGEAGARGVAAVERMPGCGRQGRERAPETTAAGILFLLGQIPGRSPPAGSRAPLSAQPAGGRHCYGAPKGAGGGAGGGT